jgi:hypothetical protein
VHRVRGDQFTIADRIEIIVVDDDRGGPYPAPPRKPFIETLRAQGIDADQRDAPSGAEGSTAVIALFGDIRSWKGRPGYSKGALDAIRTALAAASEANQDAIIVQFSHPRLAGSIPGEAPIVCAWGGESVMQRGAARVLAGMRTALSDSVKGGTVK